METIKLSQGSQMPIIGMGTNTFGKVENQYTAEINMDTSELENAIYNGYRHFDTAISYRNESVIGKAIKDSHLPRNDFFITSKIPGEAPYNLNPEEVRKAVHASLEALQSDYIDLYLIHHPWENIESIIQMYQTLETMVDEGLIKEIGVSNFNEFQLAELLKHARIKPAVNQIESHVGHWNHDLIAFTLSHDIVPVAWSPLRLRNEDALEQIRQIGEKYDKTPQQVILNYQVNRGVAVIPKSHNKERQARNLDIFDFSLNTEEIDIISNL